MNIIRAYFINDLLVNRFSVLHQYYSLDRPMSSRTCSLAPVDFQQDSFLFKFG